MPQNRISVLVSLDGTDDNLKATLSFTTAARIGASLQLYLGNGCVPGSLSIRVRQRPSVSQATRRQTPLSRAAVAVGECHSRCRAPA